MAFLATLAKLKRGDVSLFLVAALVAALLLPMSPQAATLPAPSYEAVLFWLGTEMGVSNAPAHDFSKPTLAPALTAPQKAVAVTEPVRSPLLSQATAHCGQWRIASLSLNPTSTTPRILAPRAVHSLTAPEVAHLSGVRTNIRRN